MVTISAATAVRGIMEPAISSAVPMVVGRARTTCAVETAMGSAGPPKRSALLAATGILAHANSHPFVAYIPNTIYHIPAMRTSGVAVLTGCAALVLTSAALAASSSTCRLVCSATRREVRVRMPPHRQLMPLLRSRELPPHRHLTPLLPRPRHPKRLPQYPLQWCLPPYPKPQWCLPQYPKSQSYLPPYPKSQRYLPQHPKRQFPALRLHRQWKPLSSPV